MPRVLVLMPFAEDEPGLKLRAAQIMALPAPADTRHTFRGTKARPDTFDNHHDFLISELGVFEAGLSAEVEGFDAVGIDSMSDSGMNPLRAALTIPVLGAARAAFLTALMLGNRFSVLTMWEPWKRIFQKTLPEYGLAERCASIRTIEVPPDLTSLLGGKEDVVFPRLVEQGQRCIAEGAEVIVLGSTTMHQAAAHLAAELRVPVVDPGAVLYSTLDALLAARLSHSKAAYPAPPAPKPDMIHAMMAAARARA
ncbi:MAG: hydrogenase expression protein HupH [Alphaproteobacteria bacterium]|nr:hydrogenase expression protein HupH [Alphaproteobacteria bacterium]